MSNDVSGKPAKKKWVQDEEILARYGDWLGRAIITVKDSVSIQRGVVYRRSHTANRTMYLLSIAIVVLSTCATVFGGLTSDSAGFRFVRVALPALIGLLAAAETLFDTRGRYTREAEAEFKLARLQSDIEYALLWDLEEKEDAPKERPGDQREKITWATLDKWKQSLSNVLDNATEDHISASSRATSVTLTRGRRGH